MIFEAHSLRNPWIANKTDHDHICGMAELAVGKREQNKRAKLARIQAAARTLFARRGFEATTARESYLTAQLMAIFGRFIAYYARDPAYARALVQELFFREHDPERMGRLTLEFGAHVADLVAAAQGRGELRADV